MDKNAISKNSALLSSYDEENAKVIVELLLDPDTPADTQINLINKLIQNRRQDNFFATMLMERVTYGECPCCGHENHWLIPEDVLNTFGYVTYEKDKQVPANTDANSCPKWQQACKKKKVNI